MSVERIPKQPYQQSVDEVLTALGTDGRSGLNEREAQARLGRQRKNELTAEKPVPRWKKFLAQWHGSTRDHHSLQTLLAIGHFIQPVLVAAREHVDDRNALAQSIADLSAEKLRAAGFVASTVVREGDPKRELLDEAERWQADCIFVGARGLRRIERFLLGTVSAGVAAGAHCSVEVVRTLEPLSADTDSENN